MVLYNLLPKKMELSKVAFLFRKSVHKQMDRRTLPNTLLAKAS